LVPVQKELATLEHGRAAAGRGDQHVDAAFQRLFLIVERDAADQQRFGELVVLAVFVEILLDLRGEFARRLEDQRARHAGAGAALGSSASIIGSTKLAVLPVPVWAQPRTSRPIWT
jgi:alkanesulfonate monooxygenase SsuD/methylene tetrahydromethanopterin reductase-like flavin-dependent oxidoreductase (luciferase family)